MATHSNILAWKVPWTEEPGPLCSPYGHKESDMTEHARVRVRACVCAHACARTYMRARTHMQ